MTSGRLAVAVFTVCCGSQALGDSRLRVEGVRASFCPSLAVRGLVDLNRRVALRLCLAELRLGAKPEVGVGTGELLPFRGRNDLNVLRSPWRDRWPVEPYCFGGLGFRWVRWQHGDTSFTRIGIAAPIWHRGRATALLLAQRAIVVPGSKATAVRRRDNRETAGLISERSTSSA